MSYKSTSRTDEELQKTMYFITELVGMLKSCRHDLRQSSRVEQQISIVVTKLDFLIGEYEYIVNTLNKQEADEHQLGSGFVCADCRSQKIKSGADSETMRATVVATQPIWNSSLHFALWCTRLVADEYCRDRDMCGRFPTCLLELRTVLQRLRELLPASATESKLSVADLSNACAKCGKSLEAVR